MIKIFVYIGKAAMYLPFVYLMAEVEALPSTTSVTEITLAKHKTIPHGNIDIWIIADAGNSGTIKVNGLSNDLGSGAATVRATLSGTVTGDLRFGFYGNKTGKTIDNAYIQADYGLN